MKVVVTSKQAIKPSNQTPHYLCQLKLSFLDQKQQPHYLPFVYFYASGLNKATSVRRSEKLKKSLSETLSWFYPLAGRVKDNLFVDCNDAGVPFLEVQVESSLDHVVGQSNCNSQLNNLFPYPDFDDAGDLLLAVQVNFFQCGGMAIGLCTSHKIADGLSIVMFMKFWAAVSRGDHSIWFIPNSVWPTSFPLHLIPTPITTSTALALQKTRSLQKVSCLATPPSLLLKPNTPPPPPLLSIRLVLRHSLLLYGIDIRPPLKERQYVEKELHHCPPLPFLAAMALLVPPPLKKDAIGEDCGSLVTQMRDGIRKVDSDFVRKLQEGGSGGMEGLNSKILEESGNKGGGGEAVFSLVFSSLARFPLYETDFGWERPVWVTLGMLSLDNIVFFFPIRTDDGIEALIFSNDANMAKLEADKEFLSFVSTPPPPPANAKL
ncbi:deacetylvindoline O-acetyltransferase-like [Camellia sinensis]|uniref:deacetylvindoline O-acetyltransferase-like n=1 Tax=Camellia sinensis TaxID=4442 RepID=UPI00103669AE|nr:deacetylvindoline O-acetyltransferase-like [Camellia sinensis]